jgi:hypothetical protein
MPGGNGLGLIEQIKSQGSNTPVILLMSGFSDFKPADAKAKGVEAFFSKPFALDELVASVSRALLPKNPRRTPRFGGIPEDFEAEVELESGSGPIKARILNIGAHGMFVLIDGAVPEVGKHIAFRVASPLFSFEGKGICRWKRANSESSFPYGMGIEFQDLNKEAARTLLKLLSRLSPESF